MFHYPIGLLSQAKDGNQPRLMINFIRTLSRYFVLLGISLLVFVLASLIFKIPNLFPQLKNRIITHTVFYCGFLITLFIQAAFIYSFPAALIEKRGLISAIKRGLSFFKEHFLVSLMLVLIQGTLWE